MNREKQQPDQVALLLLLLLQLHQQLNLTPHAAAGVLENLSNELGPSATFKPDFNSGSRQKGISLMSNKKNQIIVLYQLLQVQHHLFSQVLLHLNCPVYQHWVRNHLLFQQHNQGHLLQPYHHCIKSPLARLHCLH